MYSFSNLAIWSNFNTNDVIFEGQILLEPLLEHRVWLFKYHQVIKSCPKDLFVNTTQSNLLNTFSSPNFFLANSILQCLINPKTNIDQTQAYKRSSQCFTLGELTFVSPKLVQTKTPTLENTLICNHKKWNKTTMKFW